MTPDDLPVRLARRIEPEPMSGCWLWTGPENGTGYGRPFYDGRRVYAHRLIYELLVGPIPEGLQLDHLCRNRGCVSPWHLEPVTCQENLRRGRHFEREKTQCPSGHPYDEVNTYYRRSNPNKRCCRACNRIAQAARTARLR